MKAITIEEFGNPDVLKLSDVLDPLVRPADLLVRVYAAVSIARILRIAPVATGVLISEIRPSSGLRSQARSSKKAMPSLVSKWGIG